MKIENKKIRSRKNLLCVFLSALFAVLLCSCNMNFTPKPTKPIENPKLTVTRFIESIKNGSFEESEAMVSNYADLGFENVSAFKSDAVAQFFYECLIESYKVEFLDNDNVVSITDSVSETDYSVTGRTAEVRFLLTTFQTDGLTARMKEIATEIGHEKMFHGYVYDSEEKVDELVAEALEIVKEEPVEQYYKTYEISVDMIYSDNMWKMELTDEFYDILLGGYTE